MSMEVFVFNYRGKLIELLKKREWHKKIGKTYPYVQTLLGHSLITYDVIKKLLDLLRRKNIFSDEEEKILMVSSIVHDVGKEKSKWQNAVRKNEKPPKHFDEALTQNIANQLADIFDIKDKNTIIDAVKFHMSATRTNGNIISSIVSGHKTNKWKDISNIVYSIDYLASCGTVLKAYSLLSNPSKFGLAKYFYFTYHQINIRGISSTFLHNACQQAYEGKGWTPILYFPEGTVYVSLVRSNIPTIEEIKNKLQNIFEDGSYFGKEIAFLLVGNPTKAIFPKPELFDYKNISSYLEQAYEKVSVETFKKKPIENKGGINGRREIIKNYLGKEPDDKEIEIYTESFSISYPEMCVFAYSKAIYKYFIEKDKNLRDIFEKEYENIFGKGSFNKFTSCSTQLNPAKQFKQVILPFWNIDENNKKIENLTDKQRRKKLTHNLSAVFVKTFVNSNIKPLSNQFSSNIVNDLIYPQININIEEELESYTGSKERIIKGPTKNKGNIKGITCPICNSRFIEGIKANDNIIKVSGGFNNRIKFGVDLQNKSVWICDSCKYELYLGQILTKHNGPLDKTIYLFPQFNLSQQLGKEFIDKVFDIKQKAESLMSGLTENPELRMDLFRTYNIAQNVLQYFDDIETKNLEDLIITQQKQKEEEIDKSLKDELIKYFEEENIPIKGKEKDYNRALEIINQEWNYSYKDWGDFWSDLKNNRIELAKDIVKNAYKIRETYKIIAQTPNMVMIPLINSIKWGSEADINGSFRELFISSILALKLNCSVAITDNINKVDITQRRGLVYVSENHLIRQIIGDEWIREYDYINPKGRLIYSAEKWLKAIASAIVLTLKTAYSDRTCLFEILTAKTSGHLLRRIEMQDKDKNTNNAGYIKTYNLIENIKEVRI